MKRQAFDIIGDIHGEADVLKELLARLGYSERGGCFRHAHRSAIFLGDYIDRGPAIRETLRIVRAMVDGGAAQALCGNHELDVLLHDTPDGRGGWLRPHGGRFSAMQARTHAEFANRPDEWQEWLQWIQSLPLFLELPGLCAVHACWDEAAIEILRGRCLDAALLDAVADKTTSVSAAIHVLLKGPEVPLPAGIHVSGRVGNPMSQMRVRWWQDGRGRTYREACIHSHDPGPELRITADFDALLAPRRRKDDLPIFIGHYWLPPGRPTPLTPNVACLDYSVAGGGPLVAYRWDGERRLSRERFIFDPKRLGEHDDTIASTNRETSSAQMALIE